MRNESWALVYRMIPAYVLTLKNTTVLIMVKMRRLRLNSVMLIKLISKLKRIKYAKHSENTQQIKSRQKMIQRGTIFIFENICL